MKYNKLGIGEWFKITKDESSKTYIKINPIEDKYGNNFIAVDNCGLTLDAQDILPDSEVTPMVTNNDLTQYEERLREMSPKEQVATLRQFFINMMDWTEQSKAENIYILLEKSLKTITQELKTNGVEI